MKARARKFVGVTASVSFLIAYCLIAMAVGADLVVSKPGWMQAAYFVTAGLAWLPVLMAIIRWMSKPDDDGH